MPGGGGGGGGVVGARIGLGLPPPPTTELSSVSRSARRFLIFSLNLSLLLFTSWIFAHVSSPILAAAPTRDEGQHVRTLTQHSTLHTAVTATAPKVTNSNNQQ